MAMSPAQGCGDLMVLQKRIVLHYNGQTYDWDFCYITVPIMLSGVLLNHWIVFDWLNMDQE